ncbi:hypothetical protein [Rudaeicoccus suwonensis]|uniref:hypothetical protein n=1 Tax=Rudaeicoccus suwonensis TaxID=657409 RepID=UPI0011A430D1|nr:hypothetical protein [Rudaeicoccus suwonensis]
MDFVDFYPDFRKRPGMYVPTLSYVSLCGFIEGFSHGSSTTNRKDSVMARFDAWLLARNGVRPELAWPSRVLCELYPPDQLPRARDFNLAQDREAMALLFNLLDEFLDLTAGASDQ